MRLDEQTTKSFPHLAAGPLIDDHHPGAVAISFEDTTTIIPPSPSTFNLDVSLPNSDFQFARVIAMGPRKMYGIATLFRECNEWFVSRSAIDGIGHGVRDAQSTWKIYTGLMAKVAAAAELSFRIFDTDTAANRQYISVTDVRIVASVLRLTHRNWSGGSRGVWTKGMVVAW